jgi:predicted enzyme related to lactoylglutathione lyase
MAEIAYLELPAQQHAATKAFYKAAFEWDMIDYGPSYSGTESLGVNVGLQADAAGASAAPLAVVDVANLEEALRVVQAAGGEIVRPIFSFPGGRRFQFRDPSGNELAVMQVD